MRNATLVLIAAAVSWMAACWRIVTGVVAHTPRSVPISSDPMSRLVDPSAFERRCSEEIRRVRASDASCAVVVVEARTEHTNVARAARAMAWTLMGAARSRDVVTRWSALRFAILVPDATGQVAHYVAARIHRSFVALSDHGEGGKVPGDVLIGVAVCAGAFAPSPAVLIENATRAARRSRGTGSVPPMRVTSAVA